MTHPLVTPKMIEDFQRDGVALIPRLFGEFVDVLRDGVDRNMREPGPYAAENLKDGEAGRFFDDYCNWDRIPEFQKTVYESPAAN